MSIWFPSIAGPDPTPVMAPNREPRTGDGAGALLAWPMLSTLALLALLQFPSQQQSSSSACAEAEWVSFAPKAPYDPAVADIAALVWLPSLLLPCPSVLLGVGLASLSGPLPADGAATSVALGHSVAIACCGLPLAATGIGLPLVALETMWVAPVSVLNALDRDVRCARRREVSSPPALPPTSPAPAKPTAPPRAENPLPLSTAPAPLAMAF